MVQQPRLSLVIPTLNEVENLPLLLPLVSKTLAGIPHEVLIVDDGSTDGTVTFLEEWMATHQEVRILKHRGPPSLSASLLEGLQAARGQALGVMDADLQHDASLLPALLEGLDECAVVVGSRYIRNGSTRSWARARLVQSKLAAWLTRAVLRSPVKDPLSGFFVVRRAFFESVAKRLQPQGWKLLLEILAWAPREAVGEQAFHFKSRVHGHTKMNSTVVRSWLAQLIRLRFRGPQRAGFGPALRPEQVAA